MDFGLESGLFVIVGWGLIYGFIVCVVCVVVVDGIVVSYIYLNYINLFFRNFGDFLFKFD